MTRRQKDPLRRLEAPERAYLESLSRSRSAALAPVLQARILLRVSEGMGGNFQTIAAIQSLSLCP
ncbi:MAG TPA: hypothetical protein VJZ27_17565 [Aggregatilineales bacterium]|nr:hypothetical protein [Aggregatilineales bacterium]